MRTASRILMTIALLVFFSGMSFSQVAPTTKSAKPEAKTVAAPGKFIDTNSNGVCDNHEGKNAGAQGKNFVDKNNDGKCDNCGTSGNCKGAGNGCGKGQGCGNGYGKGQGCGTGCGNGHQHRNGCGNQGTLSPANKPGK